MSRDNLAIIMQPGNDRYMKVKAIFTANKSNHCIGKCNVNTQLDLSFSTYTQTFLQVLFLFSDVHECLSFIPL